MTKTTLIICIIILLLTAIITYGIVINEIYELPYEQCLKTCQYSDKIRCAEVCTKEIGNIIENLSSDIIPLIKDYIDCEVME